MQEKKIDAVIEGEKEPEKKLHQIWNRNSSSADFVDSFTSDNEHRLVVDMKQSHI